MRLADRIRGLPGLQVGTRGRVVISQEGKKKQGKITTQWLYQITTKHLIDAVFVIEVDSEFFVDSSEQKRTSFELEPAMFVI